MSSSKSHRPIPIFTQTAFPEQPELDRWHQVTEEEARLAYEMTLRNELSGGTPTVREFERAWREWTQSKYTITTCNGSAALYCAYFGLGVGCPYRKFRPCLFTRVYVQSPTLEKLPEMIP